MKTNTFYCCVAFTLTLLGCSNGASTGEDTTGTSDYAAAVPSLDILDMSLDQPSTTSQPIAMSGKIGDPASAAEIADYVRNGFRLALAKTQERIDDLFAGSVPVAAELNGMSCKVWEVDGKAEKNHYRLIVCRKDEVARLYSFLLQGKTVGAPNDSYLAILAGEGKSLPDYLRHARGAGKLAYNFDHLNTLLGGKGPSGIVGIGYRAAKGVRQLNVGLKAFKPENATQDISALYRFRHILGKGAVLRFAINADFVTKDGNGDIIGGHDGLSEFGRLAVGWSSLGFGRSAAAVCDGTLGEGKCVGLRQCWAKDGKLTAEDTNADPEASKSDWDPIACPKDADLIDAITQSPAQADTAVPADSSGEVPAPSVQEPAADPQE